MVANTTNGAQPAAVLFSCGLDSAVLLADTARRSPVQPIYVRAGLAWEGHELRCAERLLTAMPYAGHVGPLQTLSIDMRDVYPETHWAVRGQAPAFDTPDEDVYLEGRNVVLLAKASVYMARSHLTRVLLGPLAGNPFPDATPEFFAIMARALSLGLASPIVVETPLASMHKAGVIRLGADLGVPFELTLSCMQPAIDASERAEANDSPEVAGDGAAPAGEGPGDGKRFGKAIEILHCGRCSKCRERRDGFAEAGIADPTVYAERPLR